MKKVFCKEMHPELTLVHNETGEELISGVAITKVSTEEEFGMLYLAGIERCYGLTGLQYDVLLGCWKWATFASGDEGNIIHSDKIFKQRLINSGVKSSASSIDTAICLLAKKGLLIKLSKACYMLNPQIFFKGNRNDKCKLESRIILSK